MAISRLEESERDESARSAAHPQPFSLPTAIQGTPIPSGRRALLLCKRSRWEWEIKRAGSEEKAEARVARSGIDPRQLQDKHAQQKKIENHLIQQFASEGCRVERVSLSRLSESLDYDVDLVLSAGGDGTFLSAAAAIQRPIPLVGVNTDPVGSEGHLCIGGKNAPLDLASLLLSGNARWQKRSRLSVSIKGEAGPFLALNDVFVGEKEAAKVSYYEISVDGAPLLRQKSSGLLICTGTGSSAWYTSLNRARESVVEEVLAAVAASLSLSSPSSHSTQPLPAASAIADSINQRLAFPPNAKYMRYSIREPIFNGTFSKMHSPGRAYSIRLRSRCSNGVLVLDGSRQLAFPYGAEAYIEMSSQPLLTLY